MTASRSPRTTIPVAAFPRTPFRPFPLSVPTGVTGVVARPTKWPDALGD